ncbi:MAG: D-alanyl-D-alanine carboxypeptidase/D-alanyl-D-alanine-endopeptidase [Bacteroides sp.]|nr:D-alanyl-D-alanine carboxypeptidase/D-alanyl-D-alanine-endopeptidase [Bacteroides sp.]
MKKAFYCLLLTGLLAGGSIQAQEQEAQAPAFATRLEQLVKNELPIGSNIGIYVYDLTDDRPLYDYQGDKLSRPASTMKLVTTITTLAQPKADEPFRTEVWYRGEVRKNTLHGDLYVVGGMDPEFDDAAMDSLANVIARLPFKKIKGHLYGDVSLKDSIYWGAGWSWDDTPYYYQPYLTPLLLNKGVVDITATPSTQGKPARVNVTPSSTFYTLTNETLSNDEAGGRFTASRNWLENGNDLIVKGNVNKERTATVNIFNTSGEFFMHTLRERLEARGMEFAEDGYAFAELPTDDASVPATVYETPVQKVVNQLMKESDNLNTEAMLVRLAYQSTGHRHVSAEDGLQAVRAQIDSLGLDSEQYNIADGCGLSNYNCISPRLLVTFLRFARQRADIYPKLYQSLPIGGVDGTLEHRMKKGTPSYNNVHAKTGTISGISCLAGYLTAANGHQLAFAIMNQNSLSSRAARNFQDKVCDTLIVGR